MDNSAGDVGTVWRGARWGMANDGLLALQQAICGFAFGLGQCVGPKEISSGEQFFIVASFGRLDIGIKGFKSFGRWSFAREEWRGQAQTGQKNESYADAFLHDGRVHAGNMRKRRRVSNGLRVNRDQLQLIP